MFGSYKLVRTIKELWSYFSKLQKHKMQPKAKAGIYLAVSWRLSWAIKCVPISKSKPQNLNLETKVKTAT